MCEPSVRPSVSPSVSSVESEGPETENKVPRVELAQSDSGGGTLDYSTFPTRLQNTFEKMASGNILRPVILTPAEIWTRRRQEGLLSPPSDNSLGRSEQRTERQRAFDLLDALTRSGGLSIPDAEVHVLVATAHCFDSTLIETVIQGNVNPVQKLEQSTLIMAGALYQMPIDQLIAGSEAERIRNEAPQLIS
jgi:hypothetical protein